MNAPLKTNHDPEYGPLYFPLTSDYATGQAAPSPMRADQFGNGPMDGCVFQFAADAESHLDFKRDLLTEHAAEHVGQYDLNPQAEDVICRWIADRMQRDAPGRFGADALRDLRFASLAVMVPEDMAITCVEYDSNGQIKQDRLAAVHVCMPSGWNPAAMLGRSFAQIHRTVQIPQAERFLLEHGRVKNYVGQMMQCTTSHVRFIWTLQVGNARNRNPVTRHPPPAMQIDRNTGATNIFFRVERQTITSFPEAAVSLFTIRTYLYPLETIVTEPTRCQLLKDAVSAMPPRVIAYKGFSKEMLAYIEKL